MFYENMRKCFWVQLKCVILNIILEVIFNFNLNVVLCVPIIYESFMKDRNIWQNTLFYGRIISNVSVLEAV